MEEKERKKLDGTRVFLKWSERVLWAGLIVLTAIFAVLMLASLGFGMWTENTEEARKSLGDLTSCVLVGFYMDGLLAFGMFFWRKFRREEGALIDRGRRSAAPAFVFGALVLAGGIAQTCVFLCFSAPKAFPFVCSPVLLFLLSAICFLRGALHSVRYGKRTKADVV